MSTLSSPLGVNNPGIPLVRQDQIGQLAGSHMHFATVALFQTAVTNEQANVAASSPVWPDGQPISVGTEGRARRIWSVSLNNANTVVIGSVKFILAATTNTVIQTTGAPASGTGNNNDLALDDTAGVIYLKTSGTWAITANVNGVNIQISPSALAAAATAGTLNVGSTYTSSGSTYVATSANTFEILTQTPPTTFTVATPGTLFQTTYTVPIDVSELEVDGTSGGGGGGGGGATVGGGGGGGGGQRCMNKRLFVVPGETLYLQVGAGGTAGTIGSAGGNGSETFIRRGSYSGSYLLKLSSAGGGSAGTSTNGGAGGGCGNSTGGATTTGAANAGISSNSGNGLSFMNEVLAGTGGGSGSVTGNGGSSGVADQYIGAVIGGVGAGSGGGGGPCWPADDNGFTATPGARSVGGATGVVGSQSGAPGSGGGGGGVNAAGAAGADGFLRIRQLRF